MKIKNDFVTNSSSASFILEVAALTTDLEEFSDTFNKFLERWSSKHEYNSRYQVRALLDPKEIIQIANTNAFEVHAWTSMYNDHSDIPWFMIWLITEQHVKGNLKEFGIDRVHLKIVED